MSWNKANIKHSCKSQLYIIDLNNRHIRVMNIESHINNTIANNILVFMKENCWHIIGSKGLGWVHLLEGSKDFILRELLNQLHVHLIGYSRWDCSCYIIKAGKLGRGINFLEVLDNNSYNGVICITPVPIFISNSQDSVLSLSFKCLKVENFCIVIPSLKPLDSWSLVPKNLLTVQ